MKFKTYMIPLAFAFGAVATGGAYAEMTDRNDALAIEQAGISLGEAIAAAEQEIGGKASRAEFEVDDGHATFEVEVVKDGEATDVTVDARDGKVIQARADSIDSADDHDGAREDRDD
jgi:uncharacterized membrane protein YkoI